MDFKVIKMALGDPGGDFVLVSKSSGDRINISQLRKGDLILRNVPALGEKIYHAGIYCGENEVIQFASTAVPTQASFSLSSSSTTSQVSSKQKGLVDKISLKKFISDKLFLVYRLKKGPPENISQNISEAMDDERDYNLFTNNCLHFALRILGISPGPMSESPQQDNDAEICMEDTFPLANYQERKSNEN